MSESLYHQRVKVNEGQTMANYYVEIDDLVHFGVKGMKWGVRKARDPQKEALKAKDRAAKEEIITKARQSLNEARGGTSQVNQLKAIKSNYKTSKRAAIEKRNTEWKALVGRYKAESKTIGKFAAADRLRRDSVGMHDRFYRGKMAAKAAQRKSRHKLYNDYMTAGFYKNGKEAFSTVAKSALAGPFSALVVYADEERRIRKS